MSDAKKTPENVEPITKKKNYSFRPNSLDTAQKHIIEWHVFVPDDVEFKDILKRDAWRHIAQHLEPMARINATSVSGKFVALLHVVASGAQWVQVEPIWYKELEKKIETNVNDEYEVAWINNEAKFGVRRLSDNIWVEQNLGSKAEANQALTNLMRDMRKAIG